MDLFRAFRCSKPCLVLAALVALASCGGGGDDAPSPSPSATGSGAGVALPQAYVPENYYPVGVGWRWTYQVTPSGGQAYLQETRITGRKQMLSMRSAQQVIDAWVFTRTSYQGTTENYYEKDPLFFALRGGNAASVSAGNPLGTGSSVAIELMAFDDSYAARLPLGPVVQIADLDGDLRPETLDFTVKGNVEGYELKQIAAVGSFAGTARIRYDITGNLTLSSGSRWPYTGTIREWRAPNVGLIAWTEEITVSGTAVGESGELRSYSAP